MDNRTFLKQSNAKRGARRSLQTLAFPKKFTKRKGEDDGDLEGLKIV